MPEPLIVHGDARNLPLPDESVDLIVTSPPYFGLRSYTDGGEHYAEQIGAEATPAEFLDALIACTREMARVLKPSGSIFLNLGDKYAGGGMGGHGSGLDGTRPQGEGNRYRRAKANVPSKSLMLIPERYRIAAVDELGLIARAVLVWSKPNGLPESVTDRVRRSHEDWVHLTKQPRYYSAIDEIREPHQDTSEHAAKRRSRSDARLDLADAGRTSTANPLGKLPGSVWEIATQPLNVPEHVSHARCCGGRAQPGCEDGLDHYAAFPMEWPRRLILGWSPVGGLVLDPFGGTGTAGLVAAMNGRVGISVDRSADYCRLSAWRSRDPKERARAMGLDPDAVAAVQRPDERQTDLFDLLGGEAA